MEAIVVADGELAQLEQLRGAAAEAGVAMACTDSAGAAGAIALSAARDDGCTVIGVGAAAGAALDAAAEHGSIRGFVSLAGHLDERHFELVEEWPEIPVLGVARPADRQAVASAVGVYLASQHAASDLIVDDLAHDADIVAWLGIRMNEHVDVAQVAFDTQDGWRIHGTQRTPTQGTRVPGVVLLHTGRSDRAVYSRLERLLAEAGMAVLNIDWRGRGESTNLGSYFELDDETKIAGWRDAAAAFETLAADPRVDADRLAAVGCVHGAEYAVRAAWRDRRVRSLVILTGYRPLEPEEDALLVSGDVDVLYVTATGHTITSQAIRDLCDRAPRGAAEFVEYPGSALGYQLFEQDHSLEPRIVAWLAEALG